VDLLCEIQRSIPRGQVNLAISSLESIKAYHDSLRNDHSRNGAVLRKILYEGLTWQFSVKTENKQDGLFRKLCRELNVGHKVLYNAAKSRREASENKSLLVMLKRNSPSFGRVITSAELLTLTGWWESDDVSTVIKGHHATYHEKVDGEVIIRQKRVIQVLARLVIF